MTENTDTQPILMHPESTRIDYNHPSRQQLSGAAAGPIMTAAAVEGGYSDDSPTIEIPVLSASDGLIKTPGHIDGALPEAERAARLERIRTIVGESEFAVNVWMRSVDPVPRDFRGAAGNNRFQVLCSDPIFEGFATIRTSEDVQSEFEQAGVSQLVTVFESDRPFASLAPDSTMGNESSVLVDFQTVSRGREYIFNYPDGIQRPGNSLDFKLWLPASLASELLTMIRADPTTIPEVGDVLMREELQLGSEWDAARPPYDTWAAQQGGQVKAAFRTSREAGPDESHIITAAMR